MYWSHIRGLIILEWYQLTMKNGVQKLGMDIYNIQLSSYTWICLIYLISFLCLSASLTNFRFCACFEQEVPWHSGNYRVLIHSERRTWHDKNIQSNSKILETQAFITDNKLQLSLKIMTLLKLKDHLTFLRPMDMIYPLRS